MVCLVGMFVFKCYCAGEMEMEMGQMDGDV